MRPHSSQAACESFDFVGGVTVFGSDNQPATCESFSLFTSKQWAGGNRDLSRRDKMLVERTAITPAAGTPAKQHLSGGNKRAKENRQPQRGVTRPVWHEISENPMLRNSTFRIQKSKLRTPKVFRERHARTRPPSNGRHVRPEPGVGRPEVLLKRPEAGDVRLETGGMRRET